eukprot:19367-Heterococcus_DN1.PRE.3
MHTMICEHGSTDRCMSQMVADSTITYTVHSSSYSSVISGVMAMLFTVLYTHRASILTYSQMLITSRIIRTRSIQ